MWYSFLQIERTLDFRASKLDQGRVALTSRNARLPRPNETYSTCRHSSTHDSISVAGVPTGMGAHTQDSTLHSYMVSIW